MPANAYELPFIAQRLQLCLVSRGSYRSIFRMGMCAEVSVMSVQSLPKPSMGVDLDRESVMPQGEARRSEVTASTSPWAAREAPRHQVLPYAKGSSAGIFKSTLDRL